jgi:iron complex outermembrane receptor protein
LPAKATTSGTYRIRRPTTTVLPQLGARYRITNDDQLFASIAKNMKAPPNFVFANTGTNVQIINGVATLKGDVKEETSYNTDVGYRHQDNKFIATLMFDVDFRTARQPRSIRVHPGQHPTPTSARYRTAASKSKQATCRSTAWSFYASYGYSKSEIKSDLKVTSTAFLPTAGKEMPLTPKLEGRPVGRVLSRVRSMPA